MKRTNLSQLLEEKPLRMVTPPAQPPKARQPIAVPAPASPSRENIATAVLILAVAVWMVYSALRTMPV